MQFQNIHFFKSLILLSAIFLISCTENYDNTNDLFQEAELTSLDYFVIRNSSGAIENHIDVDLIPLIEKDIERIKGVEYKEAFLRTYARESGLLKLSSTEATQALTHQKEYEKATNPNARVENDNRIPFTFRVAFGYQPWSGHGGRLRTNTYTFNFSDFDPSSTTNTDMCNKMKSAGGKKQALRHVYFSMWDTQGGDTMEDLYKVRYRGFSDVEGWAPWVFVGENVVPFYNGKHAEAFQVEMLPNDDDGHTLWDALYYRAYRDGNWLGWVSSGGIAGTPGVSKLQGACFRAYYF